MDRGETGNNPLLAAFSRYCGVQGAGAVNRLYEQDWERPGSCSCGKRSWGSEADALAAAMRSARKFGGAFNVYRCPGSSVWHATTHGFTPKSLKSEARIAAWHLAKRPATREWALLAEMGIGEWQSYKGRKLRAILRAFADLGLIALEQPGPGFVTATDPSGLRRVMAVGLQEYAESQGVGLDSAVF